jgi:hypothetical protein
VQLDPFPAALAPVQVGDQDDDPTTALATAATMGRGALQVTVTAHGHHLTILTAHLKSKLLTFPLGAAPPERRGSLADGVGR